MIGTLATGALSIPAPPITSSYYSIATGTVGSGGAANIEFTGLGAYAGIYKHLQIRFFGSATSNTSGTININGDGTTSNYWTHTLGGSGSGSPFATAYNNIYAPYYTGNSTNYSSYILDILDFSSTSKKKTLRLLGGYDANGSGNIFLQSILWNNTNAITSIKLFIDGSTNWNQYTQAAIYGIIGD